MYSKEQILNLLLYVSKTFDLFDGIWYYKDDEEGDSPLTQEDIFNLSIEAMSDGVVKETEIFRGIITVVHGISEDKITDEIYRYRKLYPLDERIDEELRPLAINTLIGNK